MSATAPRRDAATRTETIAWILGIVGAVLFVLAITSVIATGAKIGNAVELLDGRNTLASAAFEERVALLCASDDAPESFCGADGRADVRAVSACLEGQTLDSSPPCRILWVSALHALDASAAGSGQESESSDAADASRKLWRSALGILTGALALFVYSGKSIADGVGLSLTPLFVCAVIGLVLMFIGLGLGSTGRWSGVVISPQNRVSLSLMQLTCWTVVLIAAYAVFAGFNVGLIAETSVREGQRGESFFPAMPGWTWAVLGITAGTPFLSTLVKGWKPERGVEESAVDIGPLARIGVSLVPLQKNASPRDASIADMFFGEDVNNQTRLDITRAQKVLFTAVLLLAYIGFLIGMMNDLSPAHMAATVAGPSALFISFPDPGFTFVGLLAGTHAAYLAGKYQPGETRSSPAQPGEPGEGAVPEGSPDH